MRTSAKLLEVLKWRSKITFVQSSTLRAFGIALIWLLGLCAMSMNAHANTPGQHSVKLTWNEASCPSCTFNVYRGSVTGVCSGTPTPYATGVSATAYTDLAVTAGSTYVYAVSAVNGGESACSAEAQVTVPTAPAPPTSLQGTAQ